MNKKNCSDCNCIIFWDSYILEPNTNQFGWWREEFSQKIHTKKNCTDYIKSKRFKQKNFLQSHLRNWLTKHPELWTNPMSIKSVIRALSGPTRVIPDFIIIGVTKSGTTSLYNYLSQHPNVHPSVIKEVHFFDQHYGRGLNWYKAHFPNKLTKFFFKTIKNQPFLTGEATPPYIHHPFTKQRIFKINPKIKLIIMLRNPVERAFIHYQYQVKLGFENLPLMDALKIEEKRLEKEEERIRNDPNYYSFPRQFHSFLFNGRYADHLPKWLDMPTEQLLIINSDEFFENTSKVFSQVQSFLGLPHFELQKYEIYNPTFLDDMPSDIKNYLTEYFKPHNERLYQLINRRFNWNE